MTHRFKRLRAFTTGCLASAVVFGYPSQLLAQSNSMDDPIQGVTSTTQEAPTTAAEINDVMTGLAAGMDIRDLIEIKPDPIREHTVFMTDMWDVLLDSDYVSGTSSLTTGEWITGPTGTLTATNENGQTLEVDIALSLEILPEQWSEVDQESLDILASVSARIGMAWTTMSNTDGTESNILIWWYQWNSPTGIQTAIGPLNTVEQADIDLWRNVVPLMGDFFDDPLHYNIENYDPAMYSAWSRFRSRVAAAATAATSTVVYHFVRTAIISSLADAAGVAATTVVASASLYAAIAAGAVLILGAALVAWLLLLDELRAAGIDPTGMTPYQVYRAAQRIGIIPS